MLHRDLLSAPPPQLTIVQTGDRQNLPISPAVADARAGASLSPASVDSIGIQAAANVPRPQPFRSGRTWRRYSTAFKQRVLAELKQPGVIAEAVAEHYGVTARSLVNWRHELAPGDDSPASKRRRKAADSVPPVIPRVTLDRVAIAADHGVRPPHADARFAPVVSGDAGSSRNIAEPDSAEYQCSTEISRSERTASASPARVPVSTAQPAVRSLALPVTTSATREARVAVSTPSQGRVLPPFAGRSSAATRVEGLVTTPRPSAEPIATMRDREAYAPERSGRVASLLSPQIAASAEAAILHVPSAYTPAFHRMRMLEEVCAGDATLQEPVQKAILTSLPTPRHFVDHQHQNAVVVESLRLVRALYVGGKSPVALLDEIANVIKRASDNPAV